MHDFRTTALSSVLLHEYIVFLSSFRFRGSSLFATEKKRVARDSPRKSESSDGGFQPEKLALPEAALNDQEGGGGALLAAAQVAVGVLLRAVRRREQMS